MVDVSQRYVAKYIERHLDAWDCRRLEPKDVAQSSSFIADRLHVTADTCVGSRRLLCDVTE